MAEQASLPSYVTEFCKMFPSSGRLCRIMNCPAKTYLDINPQDATHSYDYAVGNKSGDRKFEYWLIVPWGGASMIIPVDKTKRVRYLCPSSPATPANVPATVSPFPTVWNILPVTNSPTYKSSEGRLVCYLASTPSTSGGLGLCVWYASPNSGTHVVNYTTDWPQQHWEIEFISKDFNIIPDFGPQQGSVTGGQAPTQSTGGNKPGNQGGSSGAGNIIPDFGDGEKPEEPSFEQPEWEMPQ
ncbi:hypothetical protein NP233_g12880 [Leucocoprinus birnbaumii]|uniref:AdoMet activation domain-containing protein n=1 Tax=Leucocoprinus birnbaumii TaxID=56174 RepID=A0AAD5YK08_9AGAR|nr:hypothetical protein NP233_g12880 [Leucocoprinus birnbaumii]